MVWMSKNQIILFFINILFFIETESNETLEFMFNISERQSGFHRTLCFNSLIPESYKISSVLIKETLPKDMYVDVYQVSGNNAILIKDLVDCEAPAYLATSQEVMLCSISKTGAHEVCIPVHFRYQVPHSCKTYGESVIVEMANPTISVVKVHNYSSAVSLSCFKVIGSSIYHGGPKVQPLSFKIPVGCTEDFYPALLLSAIVIPLSAAYLFLNLIKTNEVFSNII